MKPLFLILVFSAIAFGGLVDSTQPTVTPNLDGWICNPPCSISFGRDGPAPVKDQLKFKIIPLDSIKSRSIVILTPITSGMFLSDSGYAGRTKSERLFY